MSVYNAIIAQCAAYDARRTHQVLLLQRFRSYPFLLVCSFSLTIFLSFAALQTAAQAAKPRFRAVAIAEAGGIHKPFVDAAEAWLDKLAMQENFTVDYIQNTDKIDDEFLSRYQLFIQLNYPPYM